MLKKLYLIDPGCGKGYRTSLQSKDSLSLCAMMGYKLESLWGESQNNYKPQLKIAPIREKVTCTRDNLLTRNPLQQYFFDTNITFLQVLALMFQWRNRQVETCWIETPSAKSKEGFTIKIPFNTEKLFDTKRLHFLQVYWHLSLKYKEILQFQVQKQPEFKIECAYIHWEIPILMIINWMITFHLILHCITWTLNRFLIIIIIIIMIIIIIKTPW